MIIKKNIDRLVRLELGGAEVEEIAGGNEEEEVNLSNYDKYAQ